MSREIRNLLLVGGFCLFCAIGSCSGGGSSDIVSVGEKGIVVNEGHKGLLMGASKAGYDAIFDAVAANDEMGLTLLQLTGDAIRVTVDTEVLVLDRSVGMSKIRVLSGEHTGKELYTYMESIEPKSVDNE